VDEHDRLAERFESHRPHLRAVAYRMLGSLAEADDAVQEAWLRLSRSDTTGVTNLGGWLTTVVARLCLDQLRGRATRREEPLGVHVPDPVVGRAEGTDPEQAALITDAVGLALFVVLETLTPAERVAFVLHDTFAVPFAEIAPLLDRSPDAVKQLASRARRRVRQEVPAPGGDLVRQRKVADAFSAAARGGDLAGLLAVLDPDVVLRADYGSAAASKSVRGAETVARQALTFAQFARTGRPVLVNGAPGVITSKDGEAFAILAFTIDGDRILAIDILADPVRLRRLNPLATLDG
jgi:RNA polymerase sigma-70 factor (ECF subfamily)